LTELKNFAKVFNEIGNSAYKGQKTKFNLKEIDNMATREENLKKINDEL